MLVKVTEAHLFSDHNDGGCINCGEIQYGGCEPDARKYKCEQCGEFAVYGLEELAIMGCLEVVDSENDCPVSDYDDYRSEDAGHRRQ